MLIASQLLVDARVANVVRPRGAVALGCDEQTTEDVIGGRGGEERIACVECGEGRLGGKNGDPIIAGQLHAQVASDCPRCLGAEVKPFINEVEAGRRRVDCDFWVAGEVSSLVGNLE